MSTVKTGFVADRAVLLAALQEAGRIACAKPILVLASVRVEWSGDRLTWFATDLNVWRSGEVAVTVTGRPGAGLLPVELAAGFLKRCGDGDVTFMFDGDKVVLTSGRFTAKWTTEPLNDFPVCPTWPTDGIAIPGTALACALAPVVPVAMATIGDTRYYLQGVLLALDERGVTCVATDGHRLVRASVPCEAPTPIAETVVPLGGIVELAHLLKASGDTPVAYSVDSQGAHVFTINGHQLSVCLLEGTFPAWRRLIPANSQHTFTVDREVCLAAVRRVAVAADGERLSIALQVDGRTVTLVSRSTQRGEASEPLALQDQSGAAITFALDAKYLAHGLEALEGASVQCALQDATAQVVLTPVSKDSTDCLYLIMPMRV